MVKIFERLDGVVGLYWAGWDQSRDSGLPIKRHGVTASRRAIQGSGQLPSWMDTPITKRLHISGLTPALTADDIQQRLSSFGKVLNLDGFGLKDGLGQPRKFGYITLETTTGKLAKCELSF